MKTRRGVTLIELVVVLMVLGIAAGAVGTALIRTAPDATETRTLAPALLQARREAIASGSERRLRIRLAADGSVLAEDDARSGSRLYRIRVLADGSVLADPALGIDRLTGATRGPGSGTR